MLTTTSTSTRLFVQPSSPLTSMPVSELNHPSLKQESESLQILEVPKPLMLRYVLYNGNWSNWSLPIIYIHGYGEISFLVFKFLIDHLVVLFSLFGHLYLYLTPDTRPVKIKVFGPRLTSRNSLRRSPRYNRFLTCPHWWFLDSRQDSRWTKVQYWFVCLLHGVFPLNRHYYHLLTDPTRYIDPNVVLRDRKSVV